MENLIVLTPAWSSMKEPQKVYYNSYFPITYTYSNDKLPAFLEFHKVIPEIFRKFV